MQRKRPLFPEEEPEPLINLTPLIDVVFVVLIAFMILAPILEIESVHLAPAGPSSHKEPPSQKAISIAIQKDRSLWLQGKQLTLLELKKALEEKKKTSKQKTVQVIPDANTPFIAYQEVKNLLEDLGFQEMEVVLKPK